MDGSTAETRDDGSGREALAAGLSIQLELEDSGGYMTQYHATPTVIVY